jgi:hypothetical protein
VKMGWCGRGTENNTTGGPGRGARGLWGRRQMQLRGFRHGMQSRGDEIRRGVGAGRSLLCRLQPSQLGGVVALPRALPKGPPKSFTPLHCIYSASVWLC